MYRLVLLIAVATLLFVPQAPALEMFTNFHNGENIGYPPMQVPIAIYGHGGWHPEEMSRPMKVNGIEPVPAMTPTGYQQQRFHLFKRIEVKKDGQASTSSSPVPEAQTASNEKQHEVEYVGDRRWGWRSNNYNSNSSNYNRSPSANQSSNQFSTDYSVPQTTTTAAQGPTPAKLNGSVDAAQPIENSSGNDPSKTPVSVHAHRGVAPEDKGNSSSQSGASSRRPNENWRRNDSNGHKDDD